MSKRPATEKPRRSPPPPKAERQPKRKGGPTLSQQLTQLESHGLVHVALKDPELEYVFRHALMQEAAYHSLLKNQRKQLHLAAGEALERLYPDRLEDLAPVLGHHFYQAGHGPRALKYYTLAGDAAGRQYANAEAASHYTYALDAARQDEATRETWTHLYTQRGRALELNSRFDQALSNYEEMDRLAQARGDRPMVLAARVLQGKIRCTANSEFNPGMGEALSEQALRLARELGDRAAESKILWNLLNLHRLTGRSTQALDCGERSLAIARELDLREQLAFTLNDLAHVYSVAGRLEHGKAMLVEAGGLWRELGNLPMLADSLATASLYHSFGGDYEAAVALSEESFRVSQSIGNVWGQSYSRFGVGRVYWERGEPGRAIEVMEECIRLGEQAGYLVVRVTTRADLALVYGHSGAVERGIEMARLALAQAEAHLTRFRSYALAALAELNLLKGDVTQAENALSAVEVDVRTAHPLIGILIAHAHCQVALAQGNYERVLTLAGDLLAGLRQSGARPFIVEALYLEGLAYLALGQGEAARESLLEARAVAEAIGARRGLWPTLVALGQIEAQRGNLAQAGALRGQAREVVEYIADHTGTPDLRASFLHLPAVRAVLESP